VHLNIEPLALPRVVAALVLGSACFCCLSITIAGLVLSRDRLMGIGPGHHDAAVLRLQRASTRCS